MIVETRIEMSWGHFQARITEWLNATIVTGFGVYLTEHPGMFDDKRVSALWSGMDAMASQESWGLGCVVVGLMRFAALYVNGRHHRTPLVRLMTAFVSAWLLTQIVLGLAHSGVPNTGLIVYPVLVLADIYSAFRASADMMYVARKDEQTEVTSESQRAVSSSQPS